MALYQLNAGQLTAFLHAPEHFMGVQIAIGNGDVPFVVIGGLVAFPLNSTTDEELRTYLDQPWLPARDPDRRRLELFNGWLRNLQSNSSIRPIERGDLDDDFAPGGVSPSNRTAALNLLYRRFLGWRGPLPPVPPFGTPYGHLPFKGFTEADDVFYRYEAFPVSRRIDQKAKKIEADTFMVPPTEVQFMPTGFAAVARCALPSLLPAVFRWQIQPEPNSSFHCGASVPAFGQSGGGVEVKLVRDTDNRCEISDPVVIPALA